MLQLCWQHAQLFGDTKLIDLALDLFRFPANHILNQIHLGWKLSEKVANIEASSTENLLGVVHSQ